jgi:hypothetical protein
LQETESTRRCNFLAEIFGAKFHAVLLHRNSRMLKSNIKGYAEEARWYYADPFFALDYFQGLTYRYKATTGIEVFNSGLLEFSDKRGCATIKDRNLRAVNIDMQVVNAAGRKCCHEMFYRGNSGACSADNCRHAGVDDVFGAGFDINDSLTISAVKDYPGVGGSRTHFQRNAISGM